VNAGDGDDTINVGSGDLYQFESAVTVNGQAGTDKDNVNDRGGDFFADPSLTTSCFLDAALFSGLKYVTNEGHTHNAGPASARVKFVSPSWGVPLTVNAGAGNDTVNVGFELLHGAVTVNGQAGTDTVNVNDSVLGLGDTYTVTSSTLTRALFGTLN